MTSSTASVYDVAEYILAREGEMSAMKLHKLVYYCQAWHLVWDGAPLFDEEIQAWANGPVIPALYELHKGEFTVGPGFFHEKLQEQHVSAGNTRTRRRRGLVVLTALAAVALIIWAQLRRRS
jgi:uncharacterized phage-associated protein